MARAAGAGAIDSVADVMYERSGSRFSVSGVGTQTITSSHVGDLGVVDGGAQEALVDETERASRG